MIGLRSGTSDGFVPLWWKTGKIARMQESSPQAEAAQGTLARKKVLHLHAMLNELLPNMDPPQMYSDCEDYISSVFSLRTPSTDPWTVRAILAMRQDLKEGNIQSLTWVQGHKNPADGLTKTHGKGILLLRQMLMGHFKFPDIDRKRMGGRMFKQRRQGISTKKRGY